MSSVASDFLLGIVRLASESSKDPSSSLRALQVHRSPTDSSKILPPTAMHNQERVVQRGLTASKAAELHAKNFHSRLPA